MPDLFFLPHPQKSREYTIPQRQLKDQMLKIHVLELNVLQILGIWHRISKNHLVIPILKQTYSKENDIKTGQMFLFVREYTK